jgi:outer membrane protein assembly factor BamB
MPHHLYEEDSGNDGSRQALATATLVTLGSLLVLSAFLVLSANVSVATTSASDGFNQPGNVLITDQFNNRVIEVNPLTKDIVWSFGSGNPKLCNPGPNAVIGANDAERVGNGITLISGTGIPAGVAGTTACVDNRVIAVNAAGQIVWQYGQAGKTGTGYDLLNVPVFAIQLPNHDILITDQGNNRIIEVNLQKQIVWSYGPKSGPGALNSPNSAELLPNGHILIADEGNNRVIEITRSGQIVWEDDKGLSSVGFASRLPDGDTLIADSGNNRIIQVTPSLQIVFEYFTNSTKGSNANPTPTNAVRLSNGDTMIADQFNSRVILIDPQKQVVFQYGMTNVTGHGFDQLFDPYTGFVIGSYVGQTVPPTNFFPSGYN